MNIDEKVETFFNNHRLEREIFTYFEFEEQWKYLPLVDQRDEFWHFNHGTLFHAEEKFPNEWDCPYQTPVIGDKIYRKEKYVLIPYDTQCDGNKFVGLFLAENELKDVEPEW